MQPISKLLLLEILLCEVFQISLRESNISGNVNLGFVSCDMNYVSKSSRLSMNLDSIVEKLLEAPRVHDSILNWIGAINGELG